MAVGSPIGIGEVKVWPPENIDKKTESDLLEVTISSRFQQPTLTHADIELVIKKDR